MRASGNAHASQQVRRWNLEIAAMIRSGEWRGTGSGLCFYMLTGDELDRIDDYLPVTWRDVPIAILRLPEAQIILRNINVFLRTTTDDRD